MAAGWYDLAAWLFGWKSSTTIVAAGPPYTVVEGEVFCTGAGAGELFSTGRAAGEVFAAGAAAGEIDGRAE